MASFAKQRVESLDHILRFFIDDIRVTAIRCSNTMKSTQKRWSMSKDAIHAWAKLAAPCLTHSSFLQGEERIIAEYEGNNKLGRMYAEAIALGEIRGFVQNPKWAESPNQQLIQTEDGFFKVSKVLYGNQKPFVSVMNGTRNMIDNWRNFYEQSEQIDTVLHYDVWNSSKNDQDPESVECWGVTIQTMPPRSNQECIESKYRMKEIRNRITDQNIVDLNALRHIVSRVGLLNAVCIALGSNVTDIPQEEYENQDALLLEKKVQHLWGLEMHSVDFHCRCSRDSFIKQLLSLSPKELSSIAVSFNYSRT